MQCCLASTNESSYTFQREQALQLIYEHIICNAFTFNCMYLHYIVTTDIASVTMEKTVAAPRVAIFTSLSQTTPKSAVIVAERQVICPIPVTANFITDLISGLLGTYYIFHVQYSTVPETFL